MRRVDGAAALVLLGALLGASLWLEQSHFVPLVRGDAVGYVFCSASPQLLFVDSVGAILCLFLIHVAVRWWLDAGLGVWQLPSSIEIERFRPLALCGVNLLGLPMLWPSIRDWWTPIAYVTVDAHGMIAVVAAVWFVANVREARRARAAPTGTTLFDPMTRLFGTKAALAAGVIAVAVATSPHVRFSSVLIGDEPKYVRYCENWWQGRGMDVSNIDDASARPQGEAPHLFDNLRSLLPELRRTLGGVVADARYLTSWGHQFNRAEYIGNWFVRGKDQGVYQMHNPGISFVMLPAYVADRALFDLGTGRFADDLFTVNLTFLLLYGLVAVAIFRMLLAGVAEGKGVSIRCFVAAASALALPLSAFAFQFYPDTCAALILCLACARLLAPGDEAAPSRSAALALGCAVGFLPWLGVRFGPASLVAIGWLAWTCRRRGGWWFVVGWIALLLPLGLYMYHVTGSVLPNALHSAREMFEEFRWHWVPVGLLGLAFDREYGLLPLAPVYLLALPGLGIMIRERNRAVPILLTLGLSLAIPAAGHGYWNVGTTPLRHVLAIVPLGALPVAAWFVTIRRRPLLMAASLAVALASIEMALAYNLAMEKTTTTMVDASFSGWNPSLLFPIVRRAAWPPATFDGAALVFWVLASIVAVIAGSRVANTTPVTTPAPMMDRSWVGVLGGGVLLCVAGAVAIAAGAPARDFRFLPTGISGERPARLSAGEPCWIRLGDPPT
jgi:hypothetical protein